MFDAVLTANKSIPSWDLGHHFSLNTFYRHSFEGQVMAGYVIIYILGVQYGDVAFKVGTLVQVQIWVASVLAWQ